MEISSVEMDFQAIMVMARMTVTQEFAAKPWMYDSDSRISQLNLVIRGQVWHEIVECLKDTTGMKGDSVKAEEAMAEAMRRDLNRKDIRFRKKAFIVQLGNTLFKVRKRDNGYDAGPETLGGYSMEEMGWCSPSMFADLMFAFDALIPQIDSEAAPVLEDILEAKRSLERERMTERVQMTSIKALVDRFLSPLAIRCTPVVDGDKVTLQLEQIKRGSIEASLEELPGILEDTATVMDTLKPVTERKVFFHR